MTPEPIYPSTGGTPPEKKPDADPSAFDPTTQMLLDARQADRTTFRRAFLGAALAHLLLLMVTLPNLASPKEIGSAARPAKVYVVQQVRFKPPAQQKQQEIPKRKTKKIPIPDPTPDDPEPLLLEEIEPPELDLPEVDAAVFGIPDAPPAFGRSGSSAGPIHIGDGVSPPVKIYSFQPRYTEEARQARIQGTVILQAVIDAEGNVTDVQVLKGLPLGLDESAIETVAQWRYQPATQNGKPVAVYLNLLVNFTLQ